MTNQQVGSLCGSYCIAFLSCHRLTRHWLKNWTCQLANLLDLKMLPCRDQLQVQTAWSTFNSLAHCLSCVSFRSKQPGPLSCQRQAQNSLVHRQQPGWAGLGFVANTSSARGSMPGPQPSAATASEPFDTSRTALPWPRCMIVCLIHTTVLGLGLFFFFFWFAAGLSWRWHL